ncbi:SIR2 family NAD-dependent protein deacylase [Marinitenerispora sediminis]|uniref:protein acetyllysine N-acetyltransferase n=1 Tax=Marinitenerispora sediminis TaxID=1931232 RepID=A0A368T5P8_9ACTN|nr:Sir2 family NAD-dependent protein deacetylase [Marinitenerispora sediminis]RCV50696.1 NAD-dependent deacetylase [Marinitenerispora sediminis]RCV56371.1 NAD-dependent deacetylase [Marinitenerispora sediminis]RCV58706.1 NAD-dependent deacetylase [Marinitenerispora sediminis]
MPAAANLVDVAAWMAAADSVAVLTGAGVSTESGIPDFRGPQGVWTTDPGAAALFDIDTYLADADVRRRVWRMRRSHPAWTAEPNPAHRALADLDRAGRLGALITQNIDGLHQRAGTDTGRVIEVHGTIHWVVCLSCGLRTRTPEVLRRLTEEPDPSCLRCGGIQKADTISFGQRLKADVLQAAVDAAERADVFVAVGTSLTVHPVAGLCDVALRRGARLVVVNAQPTPYDNAAAAVLTEPIGQVVPDLVRRVLAAGR